jgi:hypothetical protein
MKNTNKRIDRSVKCRPTCALAKGAIPLVPISMAEELKTALVRRLSQEYTGVATRLVFQSVNEAYALASMEGEPLLFLPALAEEKVRFAADWAARQEALLAREEHLVLSV